MSFEFAPGPQTVRILRVGSVSNTPPFSALFSLTVSVRPLSSLSTLLNTIISSPLLCTIEGFRWHGFLQAADCWNSSAGARSCRWHSFSFALVLLTVFTSHPPFPRSLHSTTPAPSSSLHRVALHCTNPLRSLWPLGFCNVQVVSNTPLPQIYSH